MVTIQWHSEIPKDMTDIYIYMFLKSIDSNHIDFTKRADQSVNLVSKESLDPVANGNTLRSW